MPCGCCKNRQFGGYIASIIRTRLSELGITLVVTANVPSSLILVTLMMEVLRSSEMSVPAREHDVISQKTAFFIVTAVKTSNLT
jgi:hypothetical protein